MQYETKIDITKEEMLKANWASAVSHKALVIFLVVYEVLGLLMIILNILLGQVAEVFGYVMPCLILPLLFFFMVRMRVVDSYNKTPGIQGERKYIFDDKMIVTETQRGSSFVRYEELTRVIETNTHFYLKPGPQLIMIIKKENCSNELLSFLSDLKNQVNKK